jgi:hypothetical protein
MISNDIQHTSVCDLLKCHMHVVLVGILGKDCFYSVAFRMGRIG